MATVPASAKQIVQDFLNQYGLGDLINWAWSTYKSAGGGNTGIAAITNELPNTPTFKARFPAYAQMAKEGRAMTIQQMLDYETTARQIFQSAGIPGEFYTTPAELGQFMVNNVSTAELEARVKDAQQAMIASPQDVRNQLQTLYGVDQGHLTAFFLDPTKAEPILAQKFTSAQIAAQAGRAGVGQLSQAQAENLAQLGVTNETAASGFQQLGMEQGLFEQQQTAGESAVGLEQQLAAQFGGDTKAALEFQRRAAQRKAAFQGDTGFQVGQGGIAALAPSKAV